MSEEDKRHLRSSLNARISHLCRLVALVISVVALASVVVNAADYHFVLLGILLSIMLLAIAGLQDPNRK